MLSMTDLDSSLSLPSTSTTPSSDCESEIVAVVGIDELGANAGAAHTALLGRNAIHSIERHTLLSECPHDRSLHSLLRCL